MDLIWTIASALVTLGILVAFHEYGHFWVARRCGVKVLRFSIGFGTPLWRRRDSEGTEYTVAAIPLGGYVRMLDEREGECGSQRGTQGFQSATCLEPDCHSECRPSGQLFTGYPGVLVPVPER